MSVATKAAMDDAIAAHYADEMPGQDLTGYVLQMAGGNLAGVLEGSSSYYRQTAAGQPFATTVGLARYLDWSTQNDFLIAARRRTSTD